MAGPLIADRIKETTTTTGTGTLTLLGAATGYRSFSVFADGDTCYYVIVGTTGEWEVGLGTVGAVGTTLARTTVLSSSTGSAVSFAAGTKQVFCDQPANAAVARGNYLNTDASNYQRWSIVPTATAVTFAAETAGTGADNIDIALTPAGTGGVRLTKVKDAGDAEYTFVSGVLRVPSAMLVTAGSGYFGIDGSTHFFAPSDGKLALLNWAESGFTALQFGGTTSSFPSLKRSTTALQARLADDSDYAPFAAKSYDVNGTAGVTAGPFTTITSITVVGGIVTALTGS